MVWYTRCWRRVCVCVYWHFCFGWFIVHDNYPVLPLEAIAAHLSRHSPVSFLKFSSKCCRVFLFVCRGGYLFVFLKKVSLSFYSLCHIFLFKWLEQPPEFLHPLLRPCPPLSQKNITKYVLQLPSLHCFRL